MTRRAVVLTCLLLVLAAIYLAVAQRAAESSDASEIAIDLSAPSSLESTGGAAPASPPAAREELPGSAAPTISVPSPSAPVQQLTVTVRVLRAGSGTPVPDVDVAVMAQKFAWASMTAAEKQIVTRFGRDEVALLAHFGKRVRTDAEGRVRLAIAKDLFLACDHDGLSGSLHLQATQLRRDGDHELLLRPDASLRVRVIGSDGQPVSGLEVGLRPRWSDPAVAALHTAQDGAVGFAFTDADGRATLPRIRRWVEHFAAKGQPDRAAVRLLVCGLTDDACEFDLHSPPVAVVELVAPPLGEVVVHALDTAGRPLGDGDDFLLRLADAPAAGSWGGTAADAGAARFAHVALGRRYEAAFTGLDTVTPQTFYGPTTAGQRVSVALRAALGRPAFVGQLAGADGLDVVSLSLHLRGPNFDSAYLNTKADASGRFRCELADAWVGEPIAQIIVQQRPPDDRAPLMATLPRALTIARGDNDLGLITLQPAPRLVDGVVAVDGAPPGQRPEVAVQTADADGGWYGLRTCTTLWRAPGRFEVVGPPGRERHRLVVSATDCLPAEPIEFTPGQSDLHVTLQHGGALRCSFVLDHPELAEQVAFTLTPSHPSPAAERALHGQGRDGAGEFEPAAAAQSAARVWRGLLPGSYRLTAHAPGNDRPLLSLDALQVPVGGTCADTRLCGVDLRGKLQRLQLIVTDASSAPLAVPAVASATVDHQHLGVLVLHGAATVLTSGPVDLQISASGFCPAVATGITGRHTVRLTPLPTFALALPQVELPAEVTATLIVAPAGLPGDQTQVRLVNVPRRRGWRNEPPTTRLPLADARVEPVAYRDDEALALQIELTTGGRSVELTGHTPTLLRPPHGERVAVTIPAAAWREALAKLSH